MSTRRRRYYAYEARLGGVLWLNRSNHDFIEKRPHTVGHFQCTKFTGDSRLMTVEEFKRARELWRAALPSTGSAVQ